MYDELIDRLRASGKLRQSLFLIKVPRPEEIELRYCCKLSYPMRLSIDKAIREDIPLIVALIRWLECWKLWDSEERNMLVKMSEEFISTTSHDYAI